MIAGVILSGGSSTRMGQPKALLAATRRGETSVPQSFLERICSTFSAAGLRPIVVVTGAHDSAIRAHAAERDLNVRIVTNPDPSRGQLSSLWCALDALEHEAEAIEAIAMTPVDHPWATLATVQQLIDEFHRTQAPIVRPLAADGTHGHPVVFARETFELLRHADLTKGAKVVINRLADRIHHVASQDGGAFVDIDTPPEYARAIQGSGGIVQETPGD